jgi:hypothetical protein
MGSSFVEFRGKGFEANDATLEVLLTLLVDEIDRLPDPPKWLREIRDAWNIQATAQFGYGVMANLDEVATDDARIQTIIGLANGVLSRLEPFGATIPADFLNGIRDGGNGERYTREVPAETFLRTVRYFRGLLNSTLTTGQIDARFEPEAPG